MDGRRIVDGSGGIRLPDVPKNGASPPVSVARRMDRAFVEGKKRTEIEADDRSRYVEVEMTMFRR